MRRTYWLAATAASLLFAAAPTPADTPAGVPMGCDDLAADFSHELALFAEPGSPLLAAATVDQAQAIDADRVYAIQTVPQAAVTFLHPPAKARLADGARAALVAVTVSTAGRYRVTIDDGSWIDVVVTGSLIESNRFQGRSSCPRFHKSVEYTLPAEQRVIVQLSGSSRPVVKLAVTAVR